ncbi:MAG: starch-binding protein [Paludibacteraceae bacterium]|nr:starch-binding protein [Paludibacteraceae bacterium]
MKKSIFLFFAALLFSASAWAGWCGNSFITVNGLWCTGSNSYVHDGGKFHEKDLGTLTTLELGGEFQVWPSSTTAGTLCYKIDNGTENSISLPKIGDEGNNSKHSGSGAVDLSGLAGGSHSIAVWFKHGSDIDNNNGSNYVATFTIAAATPDPTPDPDPVADVTIYFVNTKSWPSVNAYVWGTGDPYKAWPGEAMTSTGDKAHGYDVYSYTFPETYTNCIFNGNGQTDDLTVNAGQYYDIASKTWYATLAEVPNPTPAVMETVYFINTGNWGKVNAYAWTSSNNGWPGAEMSQEAEQIAGFDVYSFTAEQGQWANLIFNNGEGTQTGDLTWHAGEYYAHSTGEWYADAAAAAAALAAVVTYDYYIAGTENLTGYNWKENGLGMIQDGDLYKHTFSALAAGTYEFKVTNGTWTDPWGYNNLSAAYEEVSEGTDGEGNPNGNIKFTTEEAKNITVTFNPTTGKITIDGLTEKAPAADVTVYFINSGEWAEVACHYWGGINASTWPGVQMTATGETYEAEGWNVYAITFPGDNTSCIFNDNKAEGATQTGNLEVHDGQYYCYANGIWYERLADVDPLDTRVYLKGEMNEWCDAGYCDMFRKEDKSENVAYRTTWLDANTTYEFKIEDAGTWLSNEGTMTKDNCTDWLFEEGLNNAKITTEYAGDYTFVWDMTTKKLSVVYPELVPTVMDLVVTNMVFDGDNMTFSGTDNEYGIVFNLVVGDPIEEGVFALDASSTVDFGGMPFTDVTGTITPDMSMGMPTSAEAVVYGFLGGSEYFQFNIDMSAGGGTSVEIWDGVATPNDGTGELTISANWDGDDVYVVVPGFNYTNYECPEVWFYVGGTTWETASIAAYGPATITVEDGGVLVEGSVMSGVTGTSYELMVFGLLPVVEEPDYTRAVTSGNYGTICLPFGSTNYTGMELYEFVGSETGKAYLGSVTTLEAGVPYIFLATGTELAVYSDGTTAATPGNHNGLHGTFTDDTEVAVGNYILKDNALHQAAATCYVNANRAYIVMSEVPTGVPTKMPGRRYIGMSVQGENEATGFENIVAPEGQTIKAIINGQLIIIRDGEMYNAQGVRL